MRELRTVGTALLLVVALGVVPVASNAGIGTAPAGGSTAAPAVDAGGTASISGGQAPSEVADARAACSYPLTITDGRGEEVTLAEEPRRIVTLAPSAAHTLWAVNASDKVIGTTRFANFLPNATSKAKVGTLRNLDTEEIVELEPDVVVAPNVISSDQVDRLESAGLTVYAAGPSNNFEDIYAKTEQFGPLSGHCEDANETVVDVRDRVTAIRSAVADEEKPGATYVFSFSSDDPGFWPGGETFIDSVITTAGLTNVPAEAGVTGFQPVNLEVVENNTESIEWMIVDSRAGSPPPGEIYDRTAAIRSDQVVVLNVNYLNQPGPYTVRALENLTQAVHPEAYEEAQAALEATPTPTATAEPTTTGTETAESMMTPTGTPGETGGDTPDRTDDPATTANGPGFTAAAGVLAVLAAVLFSRRRR
jgi:iron complex transport system substrate-binding protein